ncbi:DUF4233 domain-containing protein [Planctomonas sp. JC2975]|uniref:DUF4233 domain-containing protein n=1 Tax=Planctomonas sp. JC2975 TaxID=2729626 RepID=UPI001474E441|nr:DUF4233 domain-containing protein [Planctomonas sp. JC2975]NNC10825.1 DUF4233 domain-containing protein [Planctomonas sp. JC2975]
MSDRASARAPRQRRARGAQESLGAIVLGFELVVVFLGSLVVFGLHALPPAAALGGGAVLIVLMIVAIPLLRFRVGYWLGWFVQLVVVAAGFLVGMLFIVGAIFTAIWAYAMIAGARLDRRNAEIRASGQAADHPSESVEDSEPTHKENE